MAKNSNTKLNTEADGRTFKQVADAWLADTRSRLASTTYDRYSDTLERDIYPRYGEAPMESVTAAEVNRFLKEAPGLAKESGRTLGNSGLMVIRAVMSSVIRFSHKGTPGEQADMHYEINSYEELSVSELEMICIRAKYNHCTEMLAALLALFSGLRIGELCALGSDDVDTDRMEILVHRTLHRVKNPDGKSDKKTVIVVEELPRKTQIRTVAFPKILKDYIDEFKVPGRMLLRKNDGTDPVDPRSLEQRLDRIMDAFHLENITIERLRKTYIKGSADERILDNVFSGDRPDVPYSGALDYKWLSEEMKIDLMPLRLLVGFSAGDMSKLMGLSEEAYQDMEEGKRVMTWSEYLSLLFVFHYNGRTIDIVDDLGLFPRSLREKIAIGETA